MTHYPNKHEQKVEKIKDKEAFDNIERSFDDLSYIGRDFPIVDGQRRAVCIRCHCVMVDFEPCDSTLGAGEFRHPEKDKKGKRHWCPNMGLVFTTRNKEIVPFMIKSRRRFLKSKSIRA